MDEQKTLWGQVKRCTVDFHGSSEWGLFESLACSPIWIGLAVAVYLVWPKRK